MSILHAGPDITRTLEAAEVMPASELLQLPRELLEVLWDRFFAPVTREPPEVQALLQAVPDD